GESGEGGADLGGGGTSEGPADRIAAVAGGDADLRVGLVDDGPTAPGEAASEPADGPGGAIEVDGCAGITRIPGVGDEGAAMVVEHDAVGGVGAFDLTGEDEVLGGSGAEVTVGVHQPDLVRVAQRQLEFVGGHEHREAVIVGE